MTPQQEEGGVSRRPNETLYFNSTPVRVIARNLIGDELCALVEWPNSNRSWESLAELREQPKPRRNAA
jgi:hypothetical protein